MGLPYSIGERVLFGVFILMIVIGLGSPLYVGEQQDEHELTESAGTSFEAISSDMGTSVHNDMTCTPCHADSGSIHTEHQDVTCFDCHDSSYNLQEGLGRNCSDCRNGNRFEKTYR